MAPCGEGLRSQQPDGQYRSWKKGMGGGPHSLLWWPLTQKSWEKANERDG